MTINFHFCTRTMNHKFIYLVKNTSVLLSTKLLYLNLPVCVILFNAISSQVRVRGVATALGAVCKKKKNRSRDTILASLGNFESGKRSICSCFYIKYTLLHSQKI